MFTRRIQGPGAALALAGSLAITLAAPAAASTPLTDSWTNQVDTPYFDCDGFTASGVWTVSHRLTIFVDASGAQVRDIEHMSFTGAFVNHENGKSVADAGHATFFDTLGPGGYGDFLATIQVSERKSRFLHAAGRTDFQTGAFHGMDQADYAAACAALAD